MAVVIRMKRAGAKKRPFYRIVVADSRFARDGRYIEQLGHYDPLTNPVKFQVDKDRFAAWILRGAKASESVGVMMAKYAPEALRPARVAVEAKLEAPAEAKPEAPAEAKLEAPAEAKSKPKKAKAAAPKTARKPRVATKASQKKAMTRAKAKAKKATGVAKAKKAKKTKK